MRTHAKLDQALCFNIALPLYMHFRIVVSEIHLLEHI